MILATRLIESYVTQDFNTSRAHSHYIRLSWKKAKSFKRPRAYYSPSWLAYFKLHSGNIHGFYRNLLCILRNFRENRKILAQNREVGQGFLRQCLRGIPAFILRSPHPRVLLLKNSLPPSYGSITWKLFVLLLKSCISISKTQFLRKTCERRSRVCACLSSGSWNLSLYSSQKYANKTLLWYHSRNRTLEWKLGSNQIEWRRDSCVSFRLNHSQHFTISLRYTYIRAFIVSLSRVATSLRHYMPDFRIREREDKIEKYAVEITVVLREKRKVIVRAALEPCNYSAILLLSQRRKLAERR